MFKWHALEAREQRTVTIGIIIAVLLLGYMFIIKPFHQAKISLQQEISHQQELLPWMRQTVINIQHYQSKNSASTPVNPDQLLNTIARSIANGPMQRVPYEIQQNDNRVTITFQEVPFNQLIHWLNQLWNDHQIHTEQCQASPHQQAGLVQAHVQLKV